MPRFAPFVYHLYKFSGGGPPNPPFFLGRFELDIIHIIVYILFVITIYMLLGVLV